MTKKGRIAVLILSVATIYSSAVGANAVNLRFHPEIGKKQTMRMTSRMVTSTTAPGLNDSEFVWTFTVEFEPVEIAADGSVTMRISILRIRKDVSSSTNKFIEYHFDTNGRHELNRFAGESIAFRGESFTIVTSAQGHLVKLNTDNFYTAVAENRIAHEDRAMRLSAEIEGSRRYKNNDAETRSRQILADAEKAIRETNEKYSSREKRKETYKVEAAEHSYYGTIAFRVLLNNFLALFAREPVRQNDSWPGLVMFSLACEDPMQLPGTYTLKGVENDVCTIQIEARRNASDRPIGMSPDAGSMHYILEGAYRATMKVDQTTGSVLSKEAVMDLRGTVPMPPDKRAKFGNAVPVKARATITVENDVQNDVQNNSLEELRSQADKVLKKTNTLDRADLNVVFKLVDHLLEKNQFEDAVKYSTKTMKNFPWSPVAAQELAKHFKNEHKSKYFVFHYNDDVTRAKLLADFSDGFIDVINREFFEAKFNYPIHVYVLKDRNSFTSFLTEKAKVADPPSYGIYFPGIRSFVTYEGSGYGTFAHEIMHPLVQTNLNRLPRWADEGIPSFFEKFFGYWSQNKLILRFGFNNPWRIRQMGQKVLSLDLESIVKGNQDHSTSEQRMVSVFLYQHGKLKKYMELVSSNRKNGYNTFIEAAFEKRMSQLIPEWKQYLQEVNNRRFQILSIPVSDIFDSKEQYERFMKARSLQ